MSRISRMCYDLWISGDGNFFVIIEIILGDGLSVFGMEELEVLRKFLFGSKIYLWYIWI